MLSKLLLFFLLLFLQSFSVAQSTKLDYSIAPWFDNIKKQQRRWLLMTAFNGQFTVAVPLLNHYGFKATFFVTVRNIPQQMGDWNLIQAASRNGHEIANHTLTHPYLHTLNDDSVRVELALSNQQIDENTKPHRSVTMAYPYGDGGNETEYEKKLRIIIRQYFIGARATRNRNVPYNPYQLQRMKTVTILSTAISLQIPLRCRTWKNTLTKTIAVGGWYVPTISRHREWMAHRE